MCGILVTSGLDRPFTHAGLASLRRRGPDALGFWSGDGVNLAQTRLSVIGLDQRGTGPFENSSHVLAFNGEIYNFADIAERLEAERGDRHPQWTLAGANDAEVLLEAWTRWGPALLSQLEGFWAFTVYDKASRILTVVRDQMGIKPLYWWRSGSRIVVGSLLRTVLEQLEHKPALNFEALSEYAAYQLTFGDKTFLNGIHRVLPGHLVQFDLASGAMTDTVYEDIFTHDGAGSSPDRDWIEETRELMLQCVLSSTVSDVPFATLCSGGIDSSLLTRIADPEVAYHANYSDPDCNETFFARQVVEGTRTRLYVVNASEEFDLVERLTSIVEDFDDPTVGSVVLPLDDLLAQVRRRHKVVLTGTGGDELFGGYVRYQLSLGTCLHDTYRAAFERLAPLATVAERFEAFHRKGRTGFFRFYDHGTPDSFAKAYESCRGGDEEAAMLRFDRRHFLPALLTIDDRMSGRHSVEARPSLLHQRFVRHIASVSPAALIGQSVLKSHLRELAAPFLPAAVAHRADKMGFTTPIGTFVARSSDRVREQLRRSTFRDLYDLRHLGVGLDDKFDREVFGLLMVDLWLNRYAA